MLTLPSRYIGIDIETTGSDHRTHKIIQLGICAQQNGTPVTETQDIRQALYRYEEKALEVNKFTHQRISDGLPWPEAEKLFLDFLTAYAPKPQRLRAVGWNVGSFDLSFITQESPALAARLHYRHIELNSVNDTLGLLLRRDTMKLKKEAKIYAADMIAKYAPHLGTEAHDAGYDAVQSLYCWQWYLDFMKSDKYLYAIFRNRLLEGDGGQAEEQETEES